MTPFVPQGHHVLDFRWIAAEHLAVAAMERRSRWGGWLMPPRVLGRDFSGRALSWMAPSNSQTWHMSGVVSKAELDLVDAALVAQAGHVLADVWRVHLAAARMWCEAWDADGFHGDGTMAVSKRNLENLLRSLDQFSERALHLAHAP